MTNDITIFTKTCNICQKAKGHKRSKDGYIQNINATYFNQIVCCDLVGPLTQTNSGNKYILGIVDKFTNKIMLAPIHGTTATESALTIFNKWICSFGTPEELLSDNGTNYTSNVMKHLALIAPFHHPLITAYNLKANQQERVNRDVKMRLRILGIKLNTDFNADSTNWDDFLDIIAFNHNLQISRRTGFTPDQLVFGPNNLLKLRFRIKNEL